jgi:UDP:flavonoid glycosyltransferase YjiC (YdhE family)
MLAAASVLDRRDHEVTVLASGETRDAAERLGFEVTGYRRSPGPDIRVAFEAQADLLMATMAGAEIALDARDVLDELRPDVAVVDCMLPAALAAARATGAPTVSLVHFLYGLAKMQMLRAGGGWTTDLRSLAATHRTLGLAPAGDGLSAWEAPELVLVTAPRWLDVDCNAPANVLRAGPLDVALPPQRPARADAERPRVLLTFSTTVREGQAALIDRVCEAVAALDLDAVLTLGPAVDRDAVRIPDSIEVVAFADHDRLMPDSAAVIGHGGLLRALAHGVPQLLLPLGRDQTFNAGRVEQRCGDPTPYRCTIRADPDRPARAPDRPTIPSGGRSPRSPRRRRRTRPERGRGSRTHRPPRLTAAPPPYGQAAPSLPFVEMQQGGTLERRCPRRAQRSRSCETDHAASTGTCASAARPGRCFRGSSVPAVAGVAGETPLLGWALSRGNRLAACPRPTSTGSGSTRGMLRARIHIRAPTAILAALLAIPSQRVRGGASS